MNGNGQGADIGIRKIDNFGFVPDMTEVTHLLFKEPVVDGMSRRTLNPPNADIDDEELH